MNVVGVWGKEEVNLGTKFGPVIGPCRTELRGEVDKENLHFNPYKVYFNSFIKSKVTLFVTFQPCHEKACLRDLHPGKTQTD